MKDNIVSKFKFLPQSVQKVLNKTELAVLQKKLSQEIIVFSAELLQYNLNFSILQKASPYKIDKRNELLNIAFFCCENESISNSLKDSMNLPINKIAELSGKNKNFIETNKDYILALVLILSNGKYPNLKSYLKIKESR